MDDFLYAQNVTVNLSGQVLNIVWGDAHKSAYSLEGLRLTCPCAECQGGHENMGREVDPALFLVPAEKKWHVSEIKPVGNYAMQIYWGDGHSTGIYTWEHLRAICPCKGCHPEIYEDAV